MLKHQPVLKHSLLGTLLIHKGFISKQQLDEALRIQPLLNIKLGEVLVLKEWITKKQLRKTLVEQFFNRLAANLHWLFTGTFQPANSFAPVVNEPTIQQPKFEKLLDVVNNDLRAEPVTQHTLESLVASLIPGSNLLGAHLEVSGIEYEPGPRTTIDADGSLDLQLPAKIKKITFRNVQISGSEGQHVGDVVISNLRFGDETSVKIHLH